MAQPDEEFSVLERNLYIEAAKQITAAAVSFAREVQEPADKFARVSEAGDDEELASEAMTTIVLIGVHAMALQSAIKNVLGPISMLKAAQERGQT